MSAVTPTPLLSVYSGSKSFLRVWSQALGEELAGQGILVECINAYFIVSNMSKIRRASYMIPSADTYVRQSLKRIGLHGGSAVPFNNSPYLPHAVIDWLVERVLPCRLLLTYTHRMYNE
jgi:17beta-estradiol 17-dehydrogenase / very-long-chain 3-oxoacyl-CoA reductase